MSDDKTEKSFFDKLTLGVVKSLDKRQGICDINLEQGSPADKTAISQWEQKHSCIMPDDLKNFYLTNNGFKLKWSVKLNDTRIPVGKMEINKLGALNRIAGSGSAGGQSLAELDLDPDDDDGKESTKPKFDHRSRIFELDPCDGYGKVCLVFNNTKPDEGIPASKAEVWFMDRALQFHFLADNFLSFYRVLLLHLGLPQWQYAYTDIGLSPQAKQWFHMYAPDRIDVLQQEASDSENDKSSAATNPLDAGKVFKGKSDKRKTTNAQNTNKKKLPPPTTVKSGSTSLSRVSGTSSQVSKASK